MKMRIIAYVIWSIVFLMVAAFAVAGVINYKQAKDKEFYQDYKLVNGVLQTYCVLTDRLCPSCGGHLWQCYLDEARYNDFYHCLKCGKDWMLQSEIGGRAYYFQVFIEREWK